MDNELTNIQTELNTNTTKRNVLLMASIAGMLICAVYILQILRTRKLVKNVSRLFELFTNKGCPK